MVRAHISLVYPRHIDIALKQTWIQSAQLPEDHEGHVPWR